MDTFEARLPLSPGECHGGTLIPSPSTGRHSGDAASDILEVAADEVVSRPFPHVVRRPFLQPEFYSELKREFPPDAMFDNRRKAIGARTGRDLFKGDRDFETFLDGSPAWRRFHDYVASPEFLSLAFELFGPYLDEYGCRVDAERARLVPYTEHRFALWWRSKLGRWLGVGRGKDPNDLFVRFDVEQSTEGYRKPVHCDWPSRIFSLIVYFCDAEEIGMQGGELRIHEHVETKPFPAYERHPSEQKTRVIQTLEPRENLGVFFLCSNNSYHSVNAVQSIRDYRRFIYLNVSSTAENIW
ncbi:MAG: hypothetical protein QOD06_1203 [Candidatus Binatota bacterium]|nr:hypothetical protein [Candidatus Binatota bacterium]